MSPTPRSALFAASAVLLATVLALPADAAPVPDVPDAPDAAEAGEPTETGEAGDAADAGEAGEAGDAGDAGDAGEPADPAGPAADAPLGELLTRLQTLHGQAERATEAYHATAEELKELRAETAELAGDLADTRAELATARHRAALIARAQYRGPGLAPYLQLLVARDTETALDRKQIISRAIGNQAAVVTRLESGAKRLDALTGSSREALARQRELAGERKRRRDRVDDRLAEVADALAELTPGQLTALDELEVRGAEEERRELMEPDGPGGPGAADDGRPGGREPGGGARGADAAEGRGRGGAAGAGAAADGKPGGQRPESSGGTSGGTERAREPGAWGAADREPSRAGRRAVSYALDQVGKPYRAGAGGPRAFDSSGLTQRAWRSAGVRIPRTARGQWRELRRVPLDRMRPGDIVVYHRDASHVALYLGRGRVVEAPRTGQRVRVVPVTIRPLRGAVRPG